MDVLVHSKCKSSWTKKVRQRTANSILPTGLLALLDPLFGKAQFWRHTGSFEVQYALTPIKGVVDC